MATKQNQRDDVAVLASAVAIFIFESLLVMVMFVVVVTLSLFSTIAFRSVVPGYDGGSTPPSPIVEPDFDGGADKLIIN